MTFEVEVAIAGIGAVVLALTFSAGYFLGRADGSKNAREALKPCART